MSKIKINTIPIENQELYRTVICDADSQPCIIQLESGSLSDD